MRMIFLKGTKIGSARSRGVCLAFLLLSLSPFSAYAQEGVSQGLPESLLTLSQEIHSCADDLSQQSNRLTEQLAIALNELSLSSKTVERLKAEQKDWISSSLAMNKKFTDLSTKCVEQATELRIAWRIIWTLIGTLSALVVTAIAFLILEKKNITDIL